MATPESNLPLNHTTAFFREANLGRYTRDIAPTQAQLLGRQLLIAEVGCSSGEETWCIASALQTEGVDYSIEAFDASAQILQKAKRATYIASSSQLRPGRGWSLDSDSYLEHTRRSSGSGNEGEFLIRPSQVLHRNTIFRQLNILEQPLAHRRYDAAIIANVLFHYDEPKQRDTIVSNVLEGLVPGGVFVLESVIRNTDNGYQQWVADLPEKFALQALSSAAQTQTIWQTAHS